MKAQAVLGILLVTTLAVAIAPAQAQSEGRPWWTPEDVEVVGPSHYDRAWNIRVPLTLFGGSTGLQVGEPVQVHLDLGQEAVEAGWITKNGKPASFTLDTSASIRLVEYTQSWAEFKDPPGASVAVTVHETWLDPDQRETYDRIQVNEFNPRTNPVITLEWRLQNDIPAFQTAYYYAYFDVEQNTSPTNQKPQADYPARFKEPLDGFYWSGKGTRLFGHHPGSDTLSPTLTIIGTEPDTKITVYTYPGTSTFPIKDDIGRAGNPKGEGHPFTLGAGESQPWVLGTSSTHFMVEATKPVIAVTEAGFGSGEFIPSSDQGLSGTHFYVPPGTQVVHLIAPLLEPTNSNEKVQFTSNGFADASGCNGQVFPGDAQFWCVLTAQQHDGLEITVTNDDDHPILVQDSPPFNQGTWSQAPSIHGGPSGNEYLAVTRAEDAGGLVLSTRQSTSVDIVDRSQVPDVELQEDLAVPFGNPVQVSGQGWPVQWGQGPTPPIQVTAEGGPLAHVLHGRQTPDADAPQSTPFGGMQGKEFQVRTPFVVQAFYDGTVIEEITLETRSIEERPLSETEAFVVADGGHGTLVTNKPVSVFPMGEVQDYRRYSPAQADFLVPQVQSGGEYRGYLIDVSPAKGDGTVFVEALPGETVRVPFHVQNLGLWDGATIQDEVELSATTSPADWLGTPTFDSSELIDSDRILLDDDDEALAFVDIPIPQGSEVNSKVTVTVEGRSAGNPNMKGSFPVVVFLRPKFDVEMWFAESAAKIEHPDFQSGESQDIPIIVKNTGTGDDSFGLTTQGLEGGWAVEYLDAGTSVSTIGPLPAGEEAFLDMRITAPQTDEIPEVVLTTTATSKGLETASDQIRTFASISSGSDVTMSAREPLQRAKPGDTVRFIADVENHAETEGITLNFEVLDSDALPSGWEAKIDGATRQSLSPNQKVEVAVLVTVAEDAPAHTLGTALLRAEGEGDRDRDVRVSTAFTVDVDEVLDLSLTGPPSIAVDPGKSIELPIKISNQGNKEGIADLFVFAPGSWNATHPGSIHLAAPTQDQPAPVVIEVPPDALAGPVPLQVVAQMDGATAIHDVQVDVKPFHNITWDRPTTQDVRPGQSVSVPVVFSNGGNIEETIAFRADSIDNSATVDPSTVIIPPGATRAVTLRWTIPEDREGPVTVTLRGSADARTISVPVVFEVKSSILDVVRLITPDDDPEVGEVAFLTAMLHNPSTTTLKKVQVRLVTDDRLVDSVRFDSIGPGSEVVAPLRWVRQTDDPVPRLTWGTDESGQFQMLGSMDLEMGGPDTDDVHATPMTPVPITLLLFATIALVARRRQPPGVSP